MIEDQAIVLVMKTIVVGMTESHHRSVDHPLAEDITTTAAATMGTARQLHPRLSSKKRARLTVL